MVTVKKDFLQFNQAQYLIKVSTVSANMKLYPVFDTPPVPYETFDSQIELLA